VKEQLKDKSVMTLIASAAMFANMCFAQTPPTNPGQETVDFMNTPLGTGVVQKVQILMAASFGMLGISNELVRVSDDNTIDLPTRQFAQNALLTYDRSATNTYEEVVAFLSTWPFGEETPPPMTVDTIIVMKRGLEIGSSGFVLLHNTLSNTNYPVFYREQMSQLFTNVVDKIITTKQGWDY